MVRGTKPGYTTVEKRATVSVAHVEAPVGCAWWWPDLSRATSADQRTQVLARTTRRT